VIEVEWHYELADDGSITVDPEDYSGLTLEQVKQSIFEECLDNARTGLRAYVPNLDEIAEEILEKARRDNNDY